MRIRMRMQNSASTSTNAGTAPYPSPLTPDEMTAVPWSVKDHYFTLGFRSAMELLALPDDQSNWLLAYDYARAHFSEYNSHE